MISVRIAEKRLCVGGEAMPLLSGEMHFWRLDPACWPRILGRLQELDLRIVSTYVCWDHHELKPGHYDFDGRTSPTRNLLGFLDLAADRGFYVVLRPGPYIYGEWDQAGVPAHAARYHRLHPEFLAAAENWMAAVVGAARPYLATRGGPIALWQADNEPDPWPQYYGAQLGLGEQPGIFQTFLRQRYGDIAALNAAWETRLDDFDQARAIIHPLLTERGYLNRYLDFCRFRHWYSHRVATWAVQRYRALGVDVPIYLNGYPSVEVQNWRELEAAGDFAGIDLYPTAGFSRDAEEHRQFMQGIRLIHGYSALPFISEFEAGVWYGWHHGTGVLPPKHYRFLALSALLAGAAGWNWYMLVERDNWLMSPINSRGAARPELFEVFRQIVALYRELDPPSLRKVAACAVALDVLRQAAWIERSDSPVLGGLHAAGLDYCCYDVDALPTGPGLGDPPMPALLFYGGGRWLNRAAQERLRSYVAAGGRLVFFQDQPWQDDALTPCNLLALPEPVSILTAAHPQRLRLLLGDEMPVISTPAFFVYESVSGSPIYAERISEPPRTDEEFGLQANLPIGERHIVGYRRPLGAGEMICLGVTPAPEVLLALHRWLQAPIPCRCRVPGVSIALFQRGDAFYLIAVNNGPQDCDAAVALAPAYVVPGRYRSRNVVSGEVQLADLCIQDHVLLHLPGKDGTIVQLTPVVPA